MKLRSVRAGDMIRAGGMHALVIERQRGAVLVRGLCNGSTRRIRAKEVEAIWLRSTRYGRP
jgi:ribosomal protein L2